jgi:hypothetical protein
MPNYIISHWDFTMNILDEKYLLTFPAPLSYCNKECRENELTKIREKSMVRDIGKLPAKSQIANQILIDMFDRAYSRRSWHGANLGGSIRGLKVKQALWRPASNRHNIWEIVLHAAYWKYIVWRRLANKPDSTFAISGSDWFKLPAKPNETDWKKAKAILGRYHKLLQKAATDFPIDKVYQMMPNSRLQYIDIILGIAAHDVYHAGQIQVLKRLQK